MRKSIATAVFAALASLDAHASVLPPPNATTSLTLPNTGAGTTLGYVAQGGIDARNARPKVECGAGFMNYSTSYANGYGETDRVVCTAKGHISHLWLFYEAKGHLSGVEQPAPSWIFRRSVLEYPLGTSASALPQFSAPNTSVGNVIGSASNYAWTPIDPASDGVLTNPVAVDIPAGAQFAIRADVYPVYGPSGQAAALAAGGTLTVSQTYYYKISALRFGAEGTPAGTEISATPTSGNQSINLTWSNYTHPLGCDFIRIYRGTSSGAEKFLTAVPCPQTSFVDTGALTPNSSVSYATQAGVVDFNDYDNGGGNAVNGTGGSLLIGAGTSGFANVGPTALPVAIPIILADDTAANPVCALGDSILAGNGIQLNSTENNQAPSQANWFNVALPGNVNNVLNIAAGGARVASFENVNSQWGATQRMRMLDFCDTVVSDLSDNDLVPGLGNETWQQLANDQIQFAQTMARMGKKFFITTLGLHGASTDNGLDNLVNYAGDIETNRQAYNTWVWNGMQTSGGTPCNTANCGTPTPYINGYFDQVSAAGEVNASGVATHNGGYWPNATLAYSGLSEVSYTTTTGTYCTPNPCVTTITLSGGTFTAHQLIGLVVLAGSFGSTGTSCVITESTATSGGNTTLTCDANAPPAHTTSPMTITLTGSQALTIYTTPTLEGQHPTLAESAVIGAAFRTWALAKIPGVR